ncbi:MAG: flagellar hook-length control protein FliK [Burkholderiaceae bacterium]|uniref:flagellar hook-length control protein FliK n=1 Tax=Castellaniella sp. TaxID=1955812 RepID=UPI00355D7883
MAGPSNLGTLLIQRLDALLGHPLSQRGEVARRMEPRVVTAANQSLHLGALATPTEHLPEESAEDARVAQQNQARLQRPASSGRAQDVGTPAQARAGFDSKSPSGGAQFSATARLILTLLEKYPDSPALQRATLLNLPGNDAQPLPQGAPVPGTPAFQGFLAGLFTGVLQQAIRDSGLFYEAHLARWLNQPGQAQPPDTEPQARWSGAGDAQEGAAHARTPPSGPATWLVHPETEVLVRQQLDVLATQTLIWQGEAWPQAPLRWLIQQQAAGAQASDPQGAWATTLDIELPSLGAIHVRLQLQQKKIQMQLQAADSAEHLRTHAHRLHDALSGIGLEVRQLDIHAQAEETGPPGAPVPS